VRIGLAALVAMWVAAGALAVGLSRFKSGRYAEERGSSLEVASVNELMGRTFWEFRRAGAMLTWVKAQNYFHSGFDLMYLGTKTWKEGEKEELADLMRRKEEGGATPGDAQEEPGHRDEENPFLGHPEMTRTMLRPYVLDHEHRADAVIRMLPWYWLTTMLDPHYVRAYVNGAWWLAFDLKMDDQAMSYLREGLANNPNNSELLFYVGRIYMGRFDNFARASSYFESALHGVGLDPEQEEDVWRFLAFSLEKNGEYARALKAAEDGLQKYPGAVGFSTVIRRCRQKLQKPGGS